MILEAFFGFVLEIFGELVGGSLMELCCGKLANILPLRLRYGTGWRWRARQIIADRRIARGSYLRNV